MKKKIRFFINTLGGGGAEKVLVELLNQLNPNAFEITLITIDGGVHEKELPDYVKYKKLSKSRLHIVQKIKSKLAYRFPQYVLMKIKLMGKYDYEIAYLEGYPTRIVASLNTKAKKIAFVHCDLSVKNIIQPYYSSLHECIEEYRSFTHVCFVSEKCLTGFNDTFGALHNACVVHNVLDRHKIKEQALLPCTIDYVTTGKKLITVGRLTPQKNYSMLIKIAGCLEKLYDFELWILGDGELREELETQINDENIHSVKLLGFQNNPYPFYLKADLFVCSSLFEGYSTAVTEAVELGLPVLTTDCAGMREILNDGEYGVIVDNSEEALMNGLKTFLDDDMIWNRIKDDISKKSYEDCDEPLKEFLRIVD